MSTLFAIREASVTDAPRIRQYLSELVKEQPPVLFRRDKAPTEDEEVAFLKMVQGTDRSVVFLAEVKDEVVGMLDFHGHKKEQCAHCGGFGMSVHQAWRNKGIASKLLEELFSWARFRNFRRIELEVFSNNQQAIDLYDKHGFLQEGRKVEAVLVEGDFIDILLMAKTI
jgi:RimJ/RimL family protein N-acetyltransferase